MVLSYLNIQVPVYGSIIVPWVLTTIFIIKHTWINKNSRVINTNQRPRSQIYLTILYIGRALIRGRCWSMWGQAKSMGFWGGKPTFTLSNSALQRDHGQVIPPVYSSVLASGKLGIHRGHGFGMFEREHLVLCLTESKGRLLVQREISQWVFSQRTHLKYEWKGNLCKPLLVL